MPESWSDRRPAPRRGSDPLEQRFDRLVNAGRQLVDGVSGARPGSRSSGRPGLPRLDGLGRWVEDKLDWILEDDDDWKPEISAPPSVNSHPVQKKSGKDKVTSKKVQFFENQVCSIFGQQL